MPTTMEAFVGFVMVKDAMPRGTLVWFNNPGWGRNNGHKWQAHKNGYALIMSHTAGHSPRGHEVFQYLIEFDDGCTIYADPWNLKKISGGRA